MSWVARNPGSGCPPWEGSSLRARESCGSYSYATGGRGGPYSAPAKALLPDELYEPLPGGFAHVLLINSHNLVTSQELVLRGASCRGEETGVRAGKAQAWVGGGCHCLRERELTWVQAALRAEWCQWQGRCLRPGPLLPVADGGQRTGEREERPSFGWEWCGGKGLLLRRGS